MSSTSEQGVGPVHWFEPLADHLGEAYLRYSFTRGTANEVDALVEVLGLVPGQRVLDVGCGPGRHARALAERGIEVVGVDISQRFLELAGRDAPAGMCLVRADARALPLAAGFDAAFSLCQGGFGLLGGPAAGVDGPDDLSVLAGIARALVPGGRLAVSAFSAYFQVRHTEHLVTFDASSGTAHERTSIRSPEGDEAEVEMWTTCFTPRELRLLAQAVGLEPQAVWSVTPGSYQQRPPDLDHEEFLLVARRPDEP